MVIDFQKLNEMIERCEFPLPTIEDTLQQLGGFTYATGIDFNMGYLSLPLCAESKKSYASSCSLDYLSVRYYQWVSNQQWTYSNPAL